MGADVSGDVKGVLYRVGWALALLGGVLMVWAWLAGAPFASPREGSTPSPTPGTAVAQVTASPTPEPIVPTVTPTAEKLFPTARPTRTPSSTPTATSSPTATPSATVRATRTRVESTTTAPATPGDLAPTATSTPTASETPVTPTSTATSTPAPTFPPTATPKPTNPPVTQGSWRVGVSVATGSPLDYDLAALGVGWVMNWHAYGAPPVPPGVQFAQTLRMMGGRLAHDAATVSAIAAANPGALWLISNEPDVRWQDNVTPEVYAHLYREAYIAIKAGDPNATIAAGGIAQPTPLRLRYLDRVLASYQAQFGEPLPAQAWHIHNYMLREERDSWGVDIPPGFTENQGMLYSVDDSGNVERFKQQLYDFRGWMSSHGYGGLPLIVSEFGIPMPEDYGFPPERVADFLRSTTQFMNTAGGGGLVQRWCWFSLADPRYSTGNLVDLDTREWTSLGRVWMEMVGQ